MIVVHLIGLTVSVAVLVIWIRGTILVIRNAKSGKRKPLVWEVVVWIVILIWALWLLWGTSSSLLSIVFGK